MVTKQATEAATIYATLVRGSIFVLTRAGKTFERGKPVRVTAEEKAYLIEHATDRVSRPQDREDGQADVPFSLLQKFTFREGAPS